MSQREFVFSEDFRRKFEEFHAINPQVLQRLRAAALRLKGVGWAHYGVKALFEGLRFHSALQTTDPVFKLNNNYTAFYARLLMDQEPVLAGFFETRRAAADEG